jgi:DNA repair exonuclease SbcCD nuclease subunit
MTLPEEEDMALKILHTADWHLGLRFPAFDDAGQLKLTRDRLDVVDRILGEAETFGVDAVLCAGDLFDDPSPEPEWWNGLLSLFTKRSWPNRPVFLLPGNHDPITARSVYEASHTFRRSLPSWVHVVDRPDFEFQINPDSVLYAAPCVSRSGASDLAMSLPSRQAGDERIRIGLVHGQTFDIEGCQPNFPIAEEAAVKRGLDYLAIGDTHGYREVTPNESAPTIYPGAPEPTKFSEPDAGRVAIVCFRRTGRKPRVTKHRVGRWSWRDVKCSDMETLRNLRHDDGLSTTVMRLTLDMSVSLREYEEANAIRDELKGTTVAHGRVGVMQIDRTDLRHQAATVDEFPDDIPEVLRKAIERLSNHPESPEIAKRAIYHLYRLVHARK